MQFLKELFVFLLVFSLSIVAVAEDYDGDKEKLSSKRGQAWVVPSWPYGSLSCDIQNELETHIMLVKKVQYQFQCRDIYGRFFTYNWVFKCPKKADDDPKNPCRIDVENDRQFPGPSLYNCNLWAAACVAHFKKVPKCTIDTCLKDDLLID